MCDGGERVPTASSSSSISGCSRRFSAASRITVALWIICGSGSIGSEGGLGGAAMGVELGTDGGAAAAEGGRDEGAGAPDCAGAPSSGAGALCGHRDWLDPSAGACFGTPIKYWRVPSSTLLKDTSILRLLLIVRGKTATLLDESGNS